MMMMSRNMMRPLALVDEQKEARKERALAKATEPTEWSGERK